MQFNCIHNFLLHQLKFIWISYKLYHNQKYVVVSIFTWMYVYLVALHFHIIVTCRSLIKVKSLFHNKAFRRIGPYNLIRYCCFLVIKIIGQFMTRNDHQNLYLIFTRMSELRLHIWLLHSAYIVELWLLWKVKSSYFNS